MAGSTTQSIGRVVILGGGSAGWLCAGLLAAQHGHRLQVTLIESPDVPTVGVGEGSWPTMRDSLHAIGVSESAFVRSCEATFKQGSLFRRWATGADEDLYFHPFTLPHGHIEAPLVAAWQKLAPQVPFAELVCWQPYLCAQARGPKQFATPEYAAVANYAYHFDAGRFALFLREHCTAQLGVRHVADHMVEVLAKDNGDIAALRTRAHGDIEGDLFIDCSGSQARLLAGHYGVGFVSQRHVLFCDAALAVQVPYTDPQAPVPPYTTSTAHAHGWVWDIGLQTRRGIGCVYSTAHCDDEQAQRALLDYLERTGARLGDAMPRKLRFDPGHRETFWHHNCVAIGMSAGFLEPLEASALALIEFSAGFLRDQMPATRETMDLVARRFNEACHYRWARIIEFLKLHYVLSRRDDSDFWRDNRRPEALPPRLAELLTLWRELPPSRFDFERNDEPFPSASWQYVLYGMGFQPGQVLASSVADTAKAEQYFRETAQQMRKLSQALPSHRALLQHIAQHGLPTI
jgi:2-polyprenyl-6-methoxyphenol hydroxylase-like FAD-dependent oxidoreductase